MQGAGLAPAAAPLPGRLPCCEGGGGRGSSEVRSNTALRWVCLRITLSTGISLLGPLPQRSPYLLKGVQ